MLRSHASRQFFVAGRKQLMELGFSSSTIQSWCNTERLVTVLQGVYSFGRDIESREAAWRAALIFAGAGSALAGQSACEAWRIVKPRHKIPRHILVASESGRGRSYAGRSPAMQQTRLVISHRAFLPGDIRKIDGLELIRASLALLDFAELASERDLRFAFLEACRLRLFNREEVDFCFRRMVRRRGARKLRPLLVLWVPQLSRIRSVLEGLFLLAWIATGLPLPEVNVKVAGVEVDFYWPGFRLVVETDGGSFHDDPLARARDIAKTKHLEDHGLTVLRIPSEGVELLPPYAVNMVARRLKNQTDSQNSFV